MPRYEALFSGLKGRIVRDEPLAKHTTYRIGGPAEVFVEPYGIDDLQRVVAYAHSQSLPLTVIGAGSNLLVSDQGLPGIVVKLGKGLSRISVNGFYITAEAGARLSRITSIACENGLGGLEFLAGIPASVGGAVAMNAGAHGSQISDFIRYVSVICEDGSIEQRCKDEIEFGYRQSSLQSELVIIASATLECFPKSPTLIREETKAILDRRKRTQPLEYPSAGSVFKNPPGDTAGRLIEAAGCKGMSVGGAQVSLKHANFIVNTGTAKARDVRELIAKVRERVYNKFGIHLELEVKLLGKH
ncbi:MAG: UDP-N-acetylmuramate dehydrogenase [Peptococcaceae bacterium]|nr:UDP-N-acetylmuramate dehydrogenase [Peptococcaceae bacterium]